MMMGAMKSSAQSKYTPAPKRAAAMANPSPSHMVIAPYLTQHTANWRALRAEATCRKVGIAVGLVYSG
jgi:hypothetical protein